MQRYTKDTPELAAASLTETGYGQVAEYEVKAHPQGRWAIRLFQHKRKPDKEGRECFAVQYGCQIDAPLTYGDACDKLGQALMHATCCDGLIVQAD